MTLEEFNHFIINAQEALGKVVLGYMHPQHEGDLLSEDITFTFRKGVKYPDSTIGIYQNIL